MQDCVAIFGTEVIVAHGVSGGAYVGSYFLHDVVPLSELINVTGEDAFLNPFPVALQHLDNGEPVAIAGYVVTNDQQVRHSISGLTYTMKYSALSGATPQPCQRTFF